MPLGRTTQLTYLFACKNVAPPDIGMAARSGAAPRSAAPTSVTGPCLQERQCSELHEDGPIGGARDPQRQRPAVRPVPLLELAADPHAWVADLPQQLRGAGVVLHVGPFGLRQRARQPGEDEPDQIELGLRRRRRRAVLGEWPRLDRHRDGLTEEAIGGGQRVPPTVRVWLQRTQGRLNRLRVQAKPPPPSY